MDKLLLISYLLSEEIEGFSDMLAEVYQNKKNAVGICNSDSLYVTIKVLFLK